MFLFIINSRNCGVVLGFVSLCFLQSCTWGQIVPVLSIQDTIPSGTFKASSGITIQECRATIAFSQYDTHTLTSAIEKLKQSLPKEAIGFAEVEIEYTALPFAFHNHCIAIHAFPVFKKF